MELPDGGDWSVRSRVRKSPEHRGQVVLKSQTAHGSEKPESLKLPPANS